MAKQLSKVDAEKEGPRLLLLLSRGGSHHRNTVAKDRVFECKTCKRSFPTFQALGGHMTGHKRHLEEDAASSAAAKKAAHECHLCGLVFPMGQALGGHMRRHKDIIGNRSKEDAAAAAAAGSSTSEMWSGCRDARDEDGAIDDPKGGNSPGLGAWRDGARFVDLELRLGVAPHTVAVHDDALPTTLQLGIVA